MPNKKKSSVAPTDHDREIIKLFLSSMTEEEKELIRRGIDELETKYAGEP